MDDENPILEFIASRKDKPTLFVPATTGPQNFPTSVVQLIQKVLDDNEGEGKRYPKNNWRTIHPAEHISHALQHLHRWVNFETTKLLHEANNLEPPEEEDEPHLKHALTRLAFAAELLREEKE